MMVQRKVYANFKDHTLGFLTYFRVFHRQGIYCNLNEQKNLPVPYFHTLGHTMNQESGLICGH